MAKIKLPQLPIDQAREIQAMHRQGWSVRQISVMMQLSYTTVYFFAVSKGQPAAIQEFCWCGARSYGAGLCKRHRDQAHRERRAA